VGRHRPAGHVVDLLEQREVDHPANLHAALGDRGSAQLETQQPEHVGGAPPLVGDEQQQVALDGLGAFGEGRHLGLGEELGHRRVEPVGLHPHPHQALGAPALGRLGQLVEAACV
jgi:hypothetical protein